MLFSLNAEMGEVMRGFFCKIGPKCHLKTSHRPIREIQSGHPPQDNVLAKHHTTIFRTNPKSLE